LQPQPLPVVHLQQDDALHSDLLLEEHPHEEVEGQPPVEEDVLFLHPNMTLANNRITAVIKHVIDKNFFMILYLIDFS
jgi:hypothetical protein